MWVKCQDGTVLNMGSYHDLKVLTPDPSPGRNGGGVDLSPRSMLVARRWFVSPNPSANEGGAPPRCNTCGRSNPQAHHLVSELVNGVTKTRAEEVLTAVLKGMADGMEVLDVADI